MLCEKSPSANPQEALTNLIGSTVQTHFGEWSFVQCKELQMYNECN